MPFIVNKVDLVFHVFSKSYKMLEFIMQEVLQENTILLGTAS